jgi:mono/diheme cytochrome c family protein
MVEQASQPRKYPWWVRAGLLILALGLGLFAVAVIYGLERLNIDRPATYAREEDHFKYGSLGGERGYYFQLGFGIPYWIWVALPELFPEDLPDHTPGRGYASFGYIYEPGLDPRFDLPIGTSRRNVMGIDRVWLNCGVCHTGTVRETPESTPRIVLGMPANRYDQGRWGKFLFDTAVSEKYTGDRFLAKIDELAALRRRLIAEGKLAPDPSRPPELSALDRIAFKTLVVPILRIRLLTLRDRLESFVDFTSWGPGRVDTFNSPKALLNFPMVRALHEWPRDIEPELQGNVDFPSVWNQEPRQGMHLHWDGNNTSIDERNLSAAFAATIPPVLDKCSLLRFKQFLLTAKPPPFPESRIDRGLAARGEPIYRRYCARCHGGKDPPFKGDGLGEEVGTVVPIDKIGTDRRRLDSYTPALAKAQGSLYAGYPLAASEPCPGIPGSKDYPARFSHFRKTHGYANSPLDGIWLRAPYLHNGSVPNLRQLLEPAAKRSPVFWIGYDVYDYEDVGFVTSGPAAEAQGWRYDTAVAGNGNQGHEGPEYGTDLPPGDKDALLEYLKTF